jgi:hypothetical protein
MTKLAKVAIIAACGAAVCFAAAGAVMAAGKEAELTAKGSKDADSETFGINIAGNGVSVNLPGLRVKVDESSVEVDGSAELIDLVRDAVGKEHANSTGTWVSNEPLEPISLERSLQAAGIRAIEADGAFADVVLIEGEGSAIRCALAGKVSAKAADGVSLTFEAVAGVARASVAWPKGIPGGTSMGCVLTIEVPRGTRFESMAISSTSGDLSIEAVRAGKCALIATSGDVSVGQVSADNLEINCVSGDVHVDAPAARNIEIVATSGDVAVATAPGFGYFYSLSVTSGEIVADGRATDGPAEITGTIGDGKGSLTVKCVSGDVAVSTR